MCALAGGAFAQTVNGNKATGRFSGMGTAGATVTIAPNSGGSYKLVGKNANSFEIHADLSALRPTKTRLKLYSGTTLVRDIPGPAPTDLIDYGTDRLVYSSVLSAEEEWIWPAIAIGAFLLSCVDYENTTTTSTTNGVTTTTNTSTWGWDCDFPGIVVVDGQQYANISRVVLESTSNGSLPPATSLTFSAAGGARITSLR